MKIEQFRKLEDKINNQDFNKSYKNINIITLAISYFGNIASIFLAYFMLSKILSGAISDNPILVFFISIILLTGLELIKRDIFDKFSSQYLKIRAFTKDVLPLFLLSLFIISISFYSSLSGAAEFSSKNVVIENNKKEIMTKYSDSLLLVYNGKIKEKEDEIKSTKSKLELKDKEQTDIEAVQPLNKFQRNRVKDLKDERSTLRNDIIKLETDVATSKKELIDKVKEKETEVIAETDSKKSDNKSNSLAFVIISTLIELVILAGIYFNEYYKFRSYRDKKNLLEKDTNYQKWSLYEKILEVIYSEEYKLNQKVTSSKSLIDVCKVNDLIILPKDLTNFFKIASTIGIIRTSGSARYINKEKDLAFELLKKHFKIE